MVWLSSFSLLSLYADFGKVDADGVRVLEVGEVFPAIVPARGTCLETNGSLLSVDGHNTIYIECSECAILCQMNCEHVFNRFEGFKLICGTFSYPRWRKGLKSKKNGVMRK